MGKNEDIAALNEAMDGLDAVEAASDEAMNVQKAPVLRLLSIA